VREISDTVVAGVTIARARKHVVRTLVGATALVVSAFLSVGVPQAAIATGDPGALTPAQQKLLTLVSKGFTSASCHAAAHPASGAIASLDCFNNSTPGGPTAATYDQFADQATLDSAFQQDVSISQVEPCPGGDPSPGPWYIGNPPKLQGQKVCDTYKNHNEVAWTNNATLVYVDTQSGDLASLYQWWKQYG
jgi:hypothetical protein